MTVTPLWLDEGMDRWTRVANELEAMVDELDPARLDPRDALRVTRVAARIERLGATAKVYAAPRCGVADRRALRDPRGSGPSPRPRRATRSVAAKPVLRC